MQKLQLDAVLKQNQAQLNSTKSQILKLEKLTKIDKQKVNDLHNLVIKDYISKHVFYEAQSKFIQNKNDLLSQNNQLIMIQGLIEETNAKILLNTQTLKKDILESLNKVNEQIDQLSNEIVKAKQRRKFLNLIAPVNGKVQQLVIHTTGGVVTSAQQIMVIVPNNKEIEVEAFIENKDIGFVQNNQKAVIKIEAFPYTRYGFINAQVKNISYDAISDKKLGLIYSVILSLDKDYLLINNKKIRLSPGMKVLAEIKTGKRRVIDYLLSPLRTKLDESMKER